MTGRLDASGYLEPYHRGRVRRPVSLELGDHSYGPGDAPERSWIPLAFRGFERIAHSIPVHDLLIMGTGNGLDALGAIEIFDDLRSLLVTDLHQDSLEIARRNVTGHLVPGVSLDLQFIQSDLFSGIPAGRRFTLVYENLPNIPAGPGIDVEAGINAASFYRPQASGAVPARFAAHRLELHYLCLQQARAHVERGGGILTSIGGRVPLEVAFDLHRSCGYSPELVVFGAKIQSEPEAILPAYAGAEQGSGLRFTFFSPEVLPMVAARRQAGLEGLPLLHSLSAELDRFAMDAGEAMARHQCGGAVAHTVFFILGRPET